MVLSIGFWRALPQPSPSGWAGVSRRKVLSARFCAASAEKFEDSITLLSASFLAERKPLEAVTLARGFAIRFADGA